MLVNVANKWMGKKKKQLLLLDVSDAQAFWWGWNKQPDSWINKIHAVDFRIKILGHNYFWLEHMGQRVSTAQQNTALVLSRFENNFLCIQIVTTLSSCIFLGFYTLLLLPYAWNSHPWPMVFPPAHWNAGVTVKYMDALFWWKSVVIR